jgi:hypothetical protein
LSARNNSREVDLVIFSLALVLLVPKRRYIAKFTFTPRPNPTGKLEGSPIYGLGLLASGVDMLPVTQPFNIDRS